ncbi:Hypothetical Protein FCC1311_018372 [Hondaea fermentalgiana]|uniref:Uncharacterized protein n=1 Tax=Hondaea fermentalgiana TaxID=2315210 RepID=A0A2R5G750_9STRA|nr:Hypothetical Protein FCC1311_018372 [Hondaea fermentalgiana]|eukprot:GBG25618.1 Hypothetical Protein FCC1311_018372 [Hondaea fermentalgiana]
MRATSLLLVAIVAFASLTDGAHAESPVVAVTSTRALKKLAEANSGNGKNKTKDEDDVEDDEGDEDDDDDEEEEEDKKQGNGKGNSKKKEDEDDDDDEGEEEDEDIEDALERLTCQKLRKKHTAELVEAIESFQDNCLSVSDGELTVGFAADDDSTMWEILANPAQFLSEDMACQPKCLKAIQGDDDDEDESLLSQMQSIMQVCGGPASKSPEEFLAQTVYMNMTWEDIQGNYEDLEDDIKACAPADLDESTRETCTELAEELSTYLESERGVECTGYRDNLSAQGTARRFCTKVTTKTSCEDDLKSFIKDFVKAGCGNMDLVADLRGVLAGACERIGTQYCYPVFNSFTETNLFETIEEKIEAGDADGANALVAEVCDSKCFRKVAKVQDVWDDDSWGFDLLCKTSDASCYTRFIEALKTEDDEERSQLLCSDRCFAKLARTVVAKEDTPDDVAEMLKATMKYLCIKPSSEDETEEDEEGQGAEQKCLSKVTEAEEEITTACSAAIEEGVCTEACKDVMPGWIKNNRHTCCISAALEYREAVWAEDEALENYYFWTNLTSLCDFDVDATCPLANPKYKRRRGLRLCGVAADLLNTTDVLEALTEDILAAYGISEENLANLVVSAITEGCSAGTDDESGTRRVLQDGNQDAAEVTFDILGQDDEDVDGIVGSVGDFTLENTNRALPEEMSGVEAEEFDASGSSSTPSSAPALSTLNMLAVGAVVLLHAI